MCGLAGVASTERRRFDQNRKEAFREMLEAASWRGRDATGVACVRINSAKEPAIVYKKAVKASDFIDLDHYKRIERNFDEYGYVIGHARSSTSDGWNLADNNAHPFQFGPITLVHNGTIRNARNIDSGIEHPVDSAHVAAALAKQEPIALLERLNGPFALVWHDARDGSLNFAKNPEKPLFWCYVEKENTMFWGSELEAVYAVLARNNVDIEGKFRHCTSYTHFKFAKMDNLREFTRTPFRKPHSAPGTHWNPQGAAWKEETRRLAGPSGSTTETKSESTPQTEKSTKGTSTDITSGSPKNQDGTGTGDEGVVAYRTPPKDSLRPRSRKKLRAVQERLLRYGRKIDAPICFTPEYWWSYKNQRGERGSITGHDKVKQQKFQIGNVTKYIWGQALAHGKIYGRIVNIKKDSTTPDGTCIICDYAPDLMDRFVFNPLTSGATPEVVDSGKPFPESLGLKTTVGELVHQAIVEKAIYLGPGDRKLTEKEFLTLVKHGCGFCSRDLSPEDHETILWVGPNQDTPICVDCKGSSDVRLQLGIREEV